METPKWMNDQLSFCCNTISNRRPFVRKPLTGLEKQALEQQEITEFWKELESK